MNNSNFMVLWGLFAIASQDALAARVCQEGPECVEIQRSIERIKQLEAKRHEDVIQHGRESVQVKDDDEELAKAQAEDRALRGERKTEIERTRAVRPRRHSRGKRHARSRASAHVRARFRIGVSMGTR